MVLQVSWNLGLPEEDHALRAVRQRVSVGVMLQTWGPGHIRKLKQRLIALSVQFEEGIVNVILILRPQRESGHRVQKNEKTDKAREEPPQRTQAHSVH